MCFKVVESLSPDVELPAVEVGVDEVASVEVRVRVRLEVAVGDVVLAHLQRRVEVDEGRLHVVVQGHTVDLGLSSNSGSNFTPPFESLILTLWMNEI